MGITHTMWAGAAILSAALWGASGGACAQPGTLIVLNKGDASASLIDRDTRQEVGVVATGVGPHEVAVSPDGATAVVADYGAQTPGATLTVIDVREKKVTRTIELDGYHRPHGIAFFPDGRRVAVTAETEQSLIVVDVVSGAIVAAHRTGQDATHMVAMSPDAERAYTANIASGSMTMIDLSGRALDPREGDAGRVRTVATGAGAEGIDVSPDGREVWVTNRAADTVSVVDARTLEVVETIACGRFPIRAKFTPDGARVLVSCAMSGEVAVFDARTRDEVARISMAGGGVNGGDNEGRLFQMGGPVPIGILIPPEGAHAFVACANADVVAVIDLEKLRVVDTFETRTEPDGMAFSPVELREAVVPSRPMPARARD